VLDVVPLSVATGNVRVYFTALSYSHRVVVTLKQWPLPCEARQMASLSMAGAPSFQNRPAAVAGLRRNGYSVRYSLLVDVVTRSESCGNRWSSDPPPVTHHAP
jgi:hypothetical protein